MESDYDRKFEDMKKYIPFLESMIKRLETTSSLSSNPRQAQLDKIRSLRDLLMDKKKRMKMENLLKCEQVLINLYAKVEQRDTLPNAKQTTNPGTSDSSRKENNSHLEIVRNKLKRVSKIQDEADTLPEIVRANDVDDVCMRGSVEPALFQRRPHKKSPTLSDISSVSQETPKSPEVNSKTKYTRVLFSPEPNSKIRSKSQDSSSDSVLFSRRSPKKSSSHFKKETKKSSSNKTSSKNIKDLNITLNVPQESLNSLNTKDILSRIITCNDNDVDIETLRGLRTQILSELKQTGANDDISDLILKSYAGKKSTSKAKEEIEEGELSDSESEAIESIYGSLVLVDKDKASNEMKSIPENNQPRKIQICLVINSKESESSNKETSKTNQNMNDECDLEMYSEKEHNKMESTNDEILKAEKDNLINNEESKPKSDVVIVEDDDNITRNSESQNIKNISSIINNVDKKNSGSPTVNDRIIDDKQVCETNIELMNKKSNKIADNKEDNVIVTDEVNNKASVRLSYKKEASVENTDVKSKENNEVFDNNGKSDESEAVLSPDIHKETNKSDSSLLFEPNFYKPLLDEEYTESSGNLVVNKSDSKLLLLEKPILPSTDITAIISKNESVKIPLLNESVICEKPVEKDIDSQIDILQALKNEILGDNIMPVPSLDVVVPPLHQPKLTKVALTKEIMPKKRISIEKYMKKNVTLNPLLCSDTLTSPTRDDNVKKQSLKLTEKECERFNFPTKIDINDDVSSDDEICKDSKMSTDEIYANFAPKSPDNDDTSFVEKTHPVIIPIDPVKVLTVNCKADIDMRTLLPLLSPKESPTIGNSPSSSICHMVKEINRNEAKSNNSSDVGDRNQSLLTDPRIRKDSNQCSKIDNGDITFINMDRISKSNKSTIGPNINFVSNVTQSMTPRSFDMSSNQLSEFDLVNSPHRHVYAPSFSLCDSRDAKERSVLNDVSPRDSDPGKETQSHWKDNNDHDLRGNISQGDISTQKLRYGDTSSTDRNDNSIRGHGSKTPLPLFGWSESVSTTNTFLRSEAPKPLMNFGRLDCPTTPSHPFGRSDCPPAISHPYRGSDMPTTPSHPFGRNDCPTTPIHPFGRSDCPTTPIHPFGRSDCPTTPIHPFGRSDCPTTPSHPFGRIDCQPNANNPFTRFDFPVATSNTFGMSDCPLTPNHPFGMTECPNTPSHAFGRVDSGMTPNYPHNRAEQLQITSMGQQYSKDPRLNRRSESRPQRGERHSRNYNDRGFNSGNSYQMHNRSYGRSESYRHYGRDDQEDRGRSRSMSRNERNFGRARSRETSENEFDQITDKRGAYNYDNRFRRGERDIEDRYRQDNSMGSNQDSYENVTSRPRARSVNRSDNKETENTLSVKSHAGRSFTIDTSVNSTFQDVSKNKGSEIADQSFDSRSFDKDKNSTKTCNEAVTNDSENRSKNCGRAGKDLSDKNNSFQEVKTDVKAYQKNYTSENENQHVTINQETHVQKEKSESQRVKPESNTTNSSKQVYSPKKNYRDPRLRRDYEDKNSCRSSGHSYDKKKHGINYSSDNLAKGAVLGTGYGVKNYKIPKIKRIANENQDENKQVVERKEPVETPVKKDDSKVINITKQCSDQDQNTELEGSPGRRLTRSFKKHTKLDTASKSEGIEIRKPKKAVIYDSSSDSETESIPQEDTTQGSDKLPINDNQCSKLIYAESKQHDDTTIDAKTNDSEMFFDVVSDPVIDNINSLIADLDKHIDKSKDETSEDFSKDISGNNEIKNTSKTENLCSSKEIILGSAKADMKLQNEIVDELGDKNDIKVDAVPCVDTPINDMLTNFDEPNNKTPTIFKEIDKFHINKSQDDATLPTHNIEISTDSKTTTDTSLEHIDVNKTNTNNDAIVSTTEKENDINRTPVEDEKVPITENTEMNYETSVADSTNEVNNEKTKEHNLPDSTNDVQSEMNSVVSSSLSSTDISLKELVEPSLPHQDTIAPLNSIGSLLSILQDKSKIHELLSMLEGQSADTNKIKRKLEKLSEIVSDDDEEVSDKTTNKANDSYLHNKDSTLDKNCAVTDENAGMQTSLNDEVTGTKLENIEPTINNVENIGKKVEDTLNLEQVMNEDGNESRAENKTVLKKKGKGPRKGKGRLAKAKKPQRATRATAGLVVTKKAKVKKPSRELLKLREDIKEMFLTDEMLNSTGIRMCRLAKLVDEKSSTRKEETTQSDPKPVVVIEKFKNQNKPDELVTTEKITKKKPSPKVKRNVSINEDNITNEECKASQIKSKLLTKNISVPTLKAKTSKQDMDPYEFEIDSVDTSITKESESEEASDYETSSLASSMSFGSSELLADLKKNKPKRRGKSWQTGVIKSKSKKKQNKPTENSVETDSVNIQKNIIIPDNECFIDKFYCFEKNVTSYSCRLCKYDGDDIILHYKKQHPHTEIPLARMNPVIAKEAIEQCQDVHFPAISRISTDRYVCRFCFKEFSKSKAVLESFFWHVVSMHTGEYKQTCSECANDTCFYNLDIPPPPKENSGQLIGYLCGKCNFTQVSLENLKTHVIGRHNDEQTDVYTINLAAMTKKVLKTLAKHQSMIAPRVLRSSRRSESISESIDDHNEITDKPSISKSDPVSSEEQSITIKTEKKSSNVTSMQSKIAFENEETVTASSNLELRHSLMEIKQEKNEDTELTPQMSDHAEPNISETRGVQNDIVSNASEPALPDDVMRHAHFKICYKNSGAKEYVCCINGNDNHYKTTLLISMKKHVQCKHNERWDGYCIFCKVIVTTQGVHNFRDCLEHFLDKHIDELPELEVPNEVPNVDPLPKTSNNADVSKPYINVRPLKQLISSPVETEMSADAIIQFPKIQSVVSLGAPVDLPRSSPTYPSVLSSETHEEKQYRYEEWQAEVMSKKHRVVLNAMMAEQKLVKVFKCTGKFCSFTTDNAENALLHATTHQRVGGEGALNCSYCDFDASNNGIDLVMHVFKAHGNCPYACKLCFYRATSSQLVSSHISRLHSERQSFDAILRTTTIAAPVSEDDNLMSREEAVPWYICGQRSSEGEAAICKFRTYTPAQFGEHLARHQPPYQCTMCSIIMASASELVHHMKIHGLRLYQCTCCVFGADNETDMLAHASARHPDKLPQAYLRVVTNKDGSSEIRVLPRAILNKLKVPSRDVTTSDTDNPVREAERSIALEKLIGHTEAMTSIEPIQQTTVNEGNVSADTGIVADSDLILTENIDDDITSPVLSPPPKSNSGPGGTDEVLKCKALDGNVSIVKTEPGVATNVSCETVIYCLDSDDEESRPRVIDISDDDHASVLTASTSSKTQQPRQYEKVSMQGLYKCPKCNICLRNMSGLRKHLITCISTKDFATAAVKCPHGNCTFKLSGVMEVADHYLNDHAGRRVYACGVCNTKFTSAALTKRHMRSSHKSFNFTINAPMSTEGNNKVYMVNESSQSATPKRKSSSDSSKSKRYGPQDIEQLPINPILESLVYCALCEFNTKVRLNMVRHLQLHAEQQPAPHTAPVNPVPHLETNERHFDKMLNLASSSIVARPPEKPTRTEMPSASLLAPDVSRYPKYVADRVRYTCGAKSCSYISVDESMLRIHWETLHSNSNDYLCVHCPPHQHTDMNKPLSAVRIIGHLKMHEENLYACSNCNFYHCKRVVLEKHLPKCPNDPKEAQIMVVREGGLTPTPAPVTTPASAPTMDLKPWQCGLCSFKSMLRPEVAEHCFKIHQSKMQYKCNYCPFRTSAIENVTKHQANAHSDKTEDVFYYYYREGSIPDDVDGTPRWLRQKQNSGAVETVVKAEIPEPSTSQSAMVPVAPAAVAVDLNLVKQEVEDIELSDVDNLCKRYGEYCEPSGVKYKCPLCVAVVEDTAEAMQSHLYEELKYRKWACSVCSYKAFHRTGLNEHIKSEHHRKYQEPSELPTDVNVEQWVAGLLEHQTSLIETNKQNAPAEDTSTISKDLSDDETNLEELEQAFGNFGIPRDSLFCCPKCSCTLKDEAVMKEHLECELNKIRWRCSNCTFTSQNYHEMQFHCKTVHSGLSAAPREALRDPARRAAWVRAALRAQLRARTARPARPARPARTAHHAAHTPADSHDNSLLVVRYEERVPATEHLSARKRTAPVDSDEEKLVIDETELVKKPKSSALKECPYCDFETKWANGLREHMLRHYNLKPFLCMFCDFMGHRSSLLKHFKSEHPGKALQMKLTPLPTDEPLVLALPKHNVRKSSVTTDDASKQVCLHCEKTVLDKDVNTHRHDNSVVEFGRKGEVVVKCCICLELRLNVQSLQEHHKTSHPGVPVNYAFFKLNHDSRECYYCEHCNNRFSYLRDLRSHHRATHSGTQLKYTTSHPSTSVVELDSNAKRKNDDESVEPQPKRVAKKSTTKLPFNAVAKKSTTKLPHSASDVNKDMKEYTFYGTKAAPLDEYANVTTLMPFCNTMVPFTVKKLSEIIKIEPIVLVDDDVPV